ncbi:RagB/SusD family nutrient uptake outer membrane protein [Pedobacter sp. AW31-3R]|uniref:RagB/SusD family nutrient uptake outer membrane protein n=1 Tax=Pedobacter sp. AW31-3R TaxID=3445781 RepID=UPI003FA171DC
MNNLFKLFRSVCFIAAVFSLSGCKKLLDIDPPQNERPSVVVFGSPETAKAALSGAYSGLSGTQTYSVNLTLVNALAADEIRALASSARYNALVNNTYEPITSSFTSEIWTDSYVSIYRFNSIIAGLTNNTAVEQHISRQIIAESKAMRAYCYLQLAGLFGDVPLVLSTNVQETSLQPRISVDAVYAQIIKDLTEAKTGLGEAYVSNGAVAGRMQVNRSAAAALLARAYLTTGNWQEAVNNASEVISNTSLYELLPKEQLDKIFLANSREAILQLGSALTESTAYTNEGAEFVSNQFTSSLQFTLTAGLLASFELRDLRRSAWVRDVTLNGVTAAEPYKYQNYDRESATSSGRVELPTVLRLAEMYLIRAEANAALGNTVQSIDDVNIIRKRAGLENLTAGANLQQAIEKERRVELFCERGDRWLTLKRTGRADAVLGALKPTWQSFAQLFPIPQTAIDSNPNLIQNQGYR